MLNSVPILTYQPTSCGRASKGERHAARILPPPAQEILEKCTEYCSGNRNEDITQLWWGMWNTREKLLEGFQRIRQRKEERGGKDVPGREECQ